MRDIANALQQRKGHCVFVENIVAENSPAAALSLDEKLQWIEENIGCLPIDSAICHHDDVVSSKVKVIKHDMASDDVRHHHDKAKLIEALNKCIEDIEPITPLKIANAN